MTTDEQAGLALEVERIRADVSDMYTDLVGDRLGEMFAELEDELSDPDQCDHGDLGRQGCTIDQLRRIAETIRRSRARLVPDVKIHGPGGPASVCPGCGDPYGMNGCWVDDDGTPYCMSTCGDPGHRPSDCGPACFSPAAEVALPAPDGAVVEHAQLMSGGGFHVRNDDPEVERIYPLAQWVVNSSRFGGRVFRRTVVVVEDWTEVTAEETGAER